MLSLLPRPPRLCGPTWMSRGLRLKWEAASLCALEQAAERSHHPVLILPWGRASPRRRTCGERGAPRPEDVAKSGAAPRGNAAEMGSRAVHVWSWSRWRRGRRDRASGEREPRRPQGRAPPAGAAPRSLRARPAAPFVPRPPRPALLGAPRPREEAGPGGGAPAGPRRAGTRRAGRAPGSRPPAPPRRPRRGRPLAGSAGSAGVGPAQRRRRLDRKSVV